MKVASPGAWAAATAAGRAEVAAAGAVAAGAAGAGFAEGDDAHPAANVASATPPAIMILRSIGFLLLSSSSRLAARPQATPSPPDRSVRFCQFARNRAALYGFQRVRVHAHLHLSTMTKLQHFVLTRFSSHGPRRSQAPYSRRFGRAGRGADSAEF
jgi:hypothetical protein